MPPCSLHALNTSATPASALPSPSLPVACFYLCPEGCLTLCCDQVFAPRLGDVASVIDHRATVDQLRDAEKRICRAVEWQIDVVTGTPCCFASHLVPSALARLCLLTCIVSVFPPSAGSHVQAPGIHD